ncbi:hypothetical protein KTO58_07465 [Chitinophaga pendula]|uniref:hypothetical protein n=1 Tax=Chitinophaga TaxID=79328 RepID=UPI0012FD2AEB|nr:MULTISPECIES: hypothetical protein [Chitinophaga]UCJ09011.1 hypothetical protein KTO58_07465 [Chitinophaga pendula]
MALAFKKRNRAKYLPFLVTTLILIPYPWLILLLENYFNPPPPGPRCGMPELGLILGAFIFLLPLALLLQFIFNRIWANPAPGADTKGGTTSA